MDKQEIYPVAFSDADLKRQAAELSRRVTGYDPNTGNGEDLIKDSVLFNVAYIELQNRESRRVSKFMVGLTVASVFVALASLVVAWVTYKANDDNTKWQDKQLRVLTDISRTLESANDLQAKALEISRKSSSNRTVERDARKRGTRPSP